MNPHTKVEPIFGRSNGYLSTHRSKPNSIILFVIVVCVHLLLIVIVLNVKVRQRQSYIAESVFNMVQLPSEKLELNIEPEKPLKHIQLHIPPLTLPSYSVNDFEVEPANLSATEFAAPYEFPSKKDNLYKDVFHPELRKKLQNLLPSIKHKPKIQHLGVGITLEDIGNGKCIYGDAFHKDGRIVKCGPDQGEQMMENVEKALADPLGLK
jgi:hypothetical protein